MPQHARAPALHGCLTARAAALFRLAPAQGTDEEKAEAAAVLVAVLEAVRCVAVGLAPLTPGLSRRIYAQLGYSDAQFEVSLGKWARAGSVRIRENERTQC